MLPSHQDPVFSKQPSCSRLLPIYHMNCCVGSKILIPWLTLIDTGAHTSLIPERTHILKQASSCALWREIASPSVRCLLTVVMVCDTESQPGPVMRMTSIQCQSWVSMGVAGTEQAPSSRWQILCTITELFMYPIGNWEKVYYWSAMGKANCSWPSYDIFSKGNMLAHSRTSNHSLVLSFTKIWHS